MNYVTVPPAFCWAHEKGSLILPTTPLPMGDFTATVVNEGSRRFLFPSRRLVIQKYDEEDFLS